MNNLELIKVFAEIDGVEWRDGKQGKSRLCMWAEYNPITDLALNCAARDKYLVYIDYDDDFVSIYIDSELVMPPTGVRIKSGNVCRAVIECIVKSKGKWRGE